MEEERRSATTEIAFVNKDPDQKDKKKKPDHKKRKNRIILISAIVISLCAGWFFGSILPMKGTVSLKEDIRSILGLGNSDKIDTVLDIMTSDWYFAKDIDDLETRLIDQAITGITDNEEDPHTAYFSAEDNTSFTDSINRTYVGIGVEVDTSTDDLIISRVIPGSPAEEEGLQEGDIITAVDGTDITGMDFSDARALIVGEEGTEVTITIERDGETMDVTLTRRQVSDTVNAEMIDDDTFYLQLYQFGESTSEETEAALEKYVKGKDSVNMILDLRNNTGGYLESVQALASYFIDEGDLILTEEFSDGSTEETKATGGKYENIHDIVILVNEETASAAEVMTLALKQNRDDVTIVGTTTYGKGTVQQTVTFDDGTALHYTVARWLPKDGSWINDKGIEPDIEVELPEALTTAAASMDEDETYSYDSVGDPVATAQLYLQYLGYDVDRTDGYFSSATEDALKQFETDHNLTADGVLSYDDYSSIYASIIHDWNTSHDHDTQYNKALELLNG
jgi:carboxyl-terminal processing protease